MRPIFIYVLLFFTSTTFAQQNFQGKATYQSKTTTDMNLRVNNKMSEQQKKQRMERMKSALEKTYTLNFNTTESLYKEKEKLEIVRQGGRRRFGGPGASGVRYKNIKEGKMLEEIEFLSKKFLISEKLQKPEWKLVDETKKIGSYTCFKATLTKKANEFDRVSMRRRTRNNITKKTPEKTSDETKTPKEITVTAWYTPQIPISNGPGEYWGLPGLILEINAERTAILCSEIIINPREKIEIKAPKKGKEVTRKEYNEIVSKKMQERTEQLGNRRGNSNFRRN